MIWDGEAADLGLKPLTHWPPAPRRAHAAPEAEGPTERTGPVSSLEGGREAQATLQAYKARDMKAMSSTTGWICPRRPSMCLSDTPCPPHRHHDLPFAAELRGRHPELRADIEADEAFAARGLLNRALSAGDLRAALTLRLAAGGVASAPPVDQDFGASALSKPLAVSESGERDYFQRREIIARSPALLSGGPRSPSR